MADPYRRSMEFDPSMSDDDIRAYVHEREIEPYGQELVGEVQLGSTDSGARLATWESRNKST
jgi:hypothetical protein